MSSCRPLDPVSVQIETHVTHQGFPLCGLSTDHKNMYMYSTCMYMFLCMNMYCTWYIQIIFYDYKYM